MREGGSERERETDSDRDREVILDGDNRTTHSALLHSALHSLLEVLECTQHSVHSKSCALECTQH